MSSIHILAVLLAVVAAADWLGRKPGGRILGGALLVIVLAAILANIGVIPLASANVPVYNQLLGTLAPISIFWLLLNAKLGSLKRAGGPMLAMFAIAAFGTVLGVVVAGLLLGAPDWMGEWYGPLSGMFAATYIGGGANFNALAIHYEVYEAGNLYAASAVADHVMTVVWIALLLAFPKLVRGLLPKIDAVQEADDPDAPGHRPGKPGLTDLAMLGALGVGAFVVSDALAAWSADVLGIAIPSILILTTLALILAQFEAIARLRGTQVLGMYGAYLFLAALAAYCEVAALGALGWLGIKLLAFVVLLIAIHGAVVILGGRLMKQSAETTAVVSATTVGGSTVVLPLVEKFDRPDLLLPGVVLGTLGNLLGTYVGFLLVWALA
ncbi:DUF819 family protein [Wenzhouxiangella sp. XN79A]|uniref:DUF819 family protein n=1 Tax=Wenzhouxiangella sp. XN79A TaxID=2724193 RepID=UPI00144AA5F9|nr:DUF819 family protein [Wenzhouxiangella sp. XN79A]NKI33947.1 DUF819 family protein [Wenzhouxiangella sp. XN79A]